MSDAVLTEIKNGVATITLNRPAKLNAWDTPMREEISMHLESWNRSADVRAVILTGVGERAFSAGQDLDETQKIKGGAEGLEWFQSWRRFYDFAAQAGEALCRCTERCGGRLGFPVRPADRRPCRASGLANGPT